MKKQTKTSLTTGGLGLLGYLVAGGAAYYLLRKNNTSGGVKGLGATASGNIFLPRIPLATIIGSIHRLVGDLGDAIGRAARRSGAPGWLITIIAAKEIQFFPYSRTNPAVNATGPAQMTPLTMFDVYYLAYTWGLIRPELDAYLKTKMGAYWPRFRQLALNRQADSAMGVRLLKDPEFCLTMAGLHLACLIRLFGGSGLVANAPRVILGYNRGIAWSMRGLAKDMGLKESGVINLVAKADWRWPVRFALSPAALMSTVSASEAKSYLADHFAPGGYFDQAKDLGLTTDTTI